MSGFLHVCPAADLPPGTMRRVEVGGRDVVVCNVGGTLHAVEDTCLHAGGPLHEGRLDGPMVTCPWHDWTFDVTTGTCDLNPFARLRTYRVRTRDGMVEVEAS